MKALVIPLLLTVVALSAPAAHAGHNEGAVLIVHTMPITKSTTCASFLDVQDAPQLAQPTSSAEPYEYTCIAVLATRASAPLSVTGIDFGFSYANANIIAWNSCGALDMRADGPAGPWPAPGSGTSIVWTSVVQENTVVIGYFVAYVLDEGTLSITPHPMWGSPRLLDETANFDVVAQCGFAGFAGKTGSNPTPSPVTATSWGRIKSQYGN